VKRAFEDAGDASPDIRMITGLRCPLASRRGTRRDRRGCRRGRDPRAQSACGGSPDPAHLSEQDPRLWVLSPGLWCGRPCGRAYSALAGLLSDAHVRLRRFGFPHQSSLRGADKCASTTAFNKTCDHPPLGGHLDGHDTVMKIMAVSLPTMLAIV
jgi:hypothetical protein